MPGATSYFGLLDICKPIKEGETLLVNAAAGAVGSAVGQIGKIKGMRVVGFAGSDEKVAYLKSLGFDAAYNYKTIPSLEAAIKESCPNGVDVFFDNVGGDFFDTVLRQMNTFGRVSVCGAISQYNALEPRKGIDVSPIILMKQLKVEGFIVVRWLDQWPAAFKEMAQWIQEGKLKYRETVFEGFDSMYDAFVSLFKGDNIGKVVVKI
ncbi:PREDICTED: prostaglandin reductase 1-like, partial [Amphimedon queenslandica]|uniref:15-oxoprostaglandin 13-reductase n=2 Tax=Amphimedon queenslandica TaxID=400682 RepID=A0AAN0IJX4_AMPQE